MSCFVRPRSTIAGFSAIVVGELAVAYLAFVFGLLLGAGLRG
jgi:hypothetical protein